MVHKLMIMDLLWQSSTSLANDPETKQILPKHFHTGKIWWFDWNTDTHQLHNINSNSESCEDHPFRSDSYKRYCTTTLLYCEGDGFSSIPYNPIRDTEQWPHWWSLGFTQENDGSYKVERDDKPDYDRKSISGNLATWFSLFRGTQHDNGTTNTCHPLLTGAPSLMWALAAFPFNIAELEGRLPKVLSRNNPYTERRLDPQTGSRYLDLSQLSGGEQPGRVSKRALAVELWTEPGKHGEIVRPFFF